MIVYAVMSQSSVVQLFVAGIIPGVIGGFFLMLAAYITARRKNFPVEETFNIPNVKKTAKDAALAFLLPVIILGGIFGGVVTATEGAGLAVVASLVIGFIYKEIDFKRLYESATEGAIQTASVMLLVAASVLLGEFLTIEQIPQKVAESIIDFTNNKYAVLAILNVFLLVIGFFLHSVAAIILTVPIVMPLVNAVGIDPVHFGIIVTLNLAIGQQTPPVASVLVTACSVAKADIWDVTRENISFICVLLILLLLVTYVPAIPMTLVEYFYRS
jgi:tripartite ATP-independent transporter DctM subunit